MIRSQGRPGSNHVEGRPNPPPLAHPFPPMDFRFGHWIRINLLRILAAVNEGVVCEYCSKSPQKQSIVVGSGRLGSHLMAHIVAPICFLPLCFRRSGIGSNAGCETIIIWRDVPDQKRKTAPEKIPEAVCESII